MVWTTFTTAQMDNISREIFMPLILLVNYTLLLYLLTVYWSRRNESRVRLLFAVGVLGVMCLVTFANRNDDLTFHLNEVSESCSVLTFLLQITIIGHDLNKKIKFRTVMILTRIAELLILADFVAVVLSLADALNDDFMDDEITEMLPNLCENVTLAFIFLFRYYYIIASRGWRDVWANRKVEVCWYLLFATHEIPFTVLKNASGLSWESVQALWNRVTLAGCLWMTARAKLRNSSVQSTGNGTQARSAAPSDRARSGNAYMAVAKQARPKVESDDAGMLRLKIAVAQE